MKNFIYSKATFLILSICFTLGLFTPLKVFAAESVVSNSTSELKTENIIPLAGNDVFNYATVTEVAGFTFYSTNLTPVKTVGNDNRMHRLIFKIQIGRMNPSPIRNTKFRFTVRNAYGSDIASTGWLVVGEDMTITNNPSFSGIGSVDVFVPVSKNQQLQFYFEARYDAPEGDRYHELPTELPIKNYWIYCD